MNRRSFLKLFGVTAVAAALPAIALEALHPEDLSPEQLRLDRWAQFDSNVSYGDYVILNDHPDNMPAEFRQKMFKLVEDSMREFVPPKYWHQVKYIVKGGESTADPFCEICTVAWKYTP